MSYACFVDGRIVPPGEASIRADDAGFLQGLAVFETVLFEEGSFDFVEDHLARMQNGARELGIAWPPPQDPMRAMAELAAALGVGGPLAIRLTLSRGAEGAGPTFTVTARDVVRPPDPGVVVVLAAERRRAGDPLGRVKTANRVAHVLAREAAQREGAFEALFLTDEDDVVEGTISNVFAVLDGALWTPSLERGCLPGTCRARLLADLAGAPLAPPAIGGREVAVHVDRIERSRLAGASEVFLTNTTGGVLPVVEVRGVVRDLPGAEGSVVRAVRARLREAVERYRARQRTLRAK